LPAKRSGDLGDVLVADFEKWLDAFNAHCPFKKHGQLEYHVETIRLRRSLGSAKAALEDVAFLQSLHRTLQAWGIGARASRLRPLGQFIASLQAKAQAIDELDKLTIDQPRLAETDAAGKLASLIETLDIVDNDARVVAGTKALHHILPELVVPIDRAYTQPFFGWSPTRFQYASLRCFVEAFERFAKIAEVTKPNRYVKTGWHSSRTKVLDNAVVGLFCWYRANADRLKRLLEKDPGKGV
jgi:hypothetical protein